MPDHAGLGNFAGRVDHAADGALGPDASHCVPPGSTLSMRRFSKALQSIEIPPGHAVDRGDHRRVGPQQWLHLVDDARYRMRLQRDDDVVLRPDRRPDRRCSAVARRAPRRRSAASGRSPAWPPGAGRARSASRPRPRARAGPPDSRRWRRHHRYRSRISPAPASPPDRCAAACRSRPWGSRPGTASCAAP